MSLMEVQKIERYVEDLLTVSGFRRDGAEQHLWLLLHHLYSAVAMYELMSAEDKVIIADTQKKLRYFFDSKCDLKERKRTKKEKEGMPPHPHAKEKENKKEKDEKTLSLAERENSALDEDQIAFWNECKQFIGKEYSYKMVQSFFFHWGEKAKKNHKMLWQSERSWNTAFRLAAWKNKSYSVNDEVAAIRLQKAKKKQAEEMNAAEQQQTVAAIREQADARRELELEHSKENQMLTDEYLAKNPDGILAKIARERQAKEKITTPKKSNER